MATNLGYILKQDMLAVIDGSTLDEWIGGKKAIGTTPAVSGDDAVWQATEPTSLEKVNGYCRHWYDMDTETRPFFEYSELEAFTEGQRIASALVDENRVLYVCIQDAPLGALLTDILFFEQKDDRNPVLVETTAVLMTYNTAKRKNPRQLPEQRNIDHDNAVKTLRDIQLGKIELKITQKADILPDDPGHQISYGDFNDITQAIY